MKQVQLSEDLPKTTRFNIEKKMTDNYDNNHHYIGEKNQGFKLNHIVNIDLDMDTI